MIREFSVDLVEHVAHHVNPSKAVKLHKNIKQHLGIGNSTGLGMAPFIIKHPKLIHKWMSQFYLTLEKIQNSHLIDNEKLTQFIHLLEKAKQYLDEVLTTDEFQKKKNKESSIDLEKIIHYSKEMKMNNNNNEIMWSTILEYADKNLNFDAQEIVNVQLIELYPFIADPLAEDMSVSDDMHIQISQNISSLISYIKKNYSWAIKIDFSKKENSYLFWYISEEKLEPRLGERYGENGAELEQPLGIGKMVKELYVFLINHSEVNDYSVSKFSS